MTNKMPVVGNSYRMKYRVEGCNYEIVEVIYIKPTRSGTYHIFWIDTVKHSTMNGADYLEDFWNKFEELPENNLQEIKVTFQIPNEPHLGFNSPTWSDVESKIKKESAVEKALEESKRLLREKYSNPRYDEELLADTLKNLVIVLEAERNEKAIIPNSESKIDIKEECVEPVSISKYNSELSPEVRKAMKKLKHNIHLSDPQLVFVQKFLKKSPECNAAIKNLRNAAQSLVNALDKQFGQKQVESEKKIKEETCQSLSIEDRASIWKDVSELPEDLIWQELLIKRADLSIGIASIGSRPQNIIDRLNSKEVIDYCTLTDFINSFEQMQKDIEGLKKK